LRKLHSALGLILGLGLRQSLGEKGAGLGKTGAKGIVRPRPGQGCGRWGAQTDGFLLGWVWDGRGNEDRDVGRRGTMLELKPPESLL
jgi:hypothetical protein